MTCFRIRKPGVNMQLHISVMFPRCGNLVIYFSLYVTRFRYVSATEMNDHVSVTFRLLDFRSYLLPLTYFRFFKYNIAKQRRFNNFAYLRIIIYSQSKQWIKIVN